MARFGGVNPLNGVPAPADWSADRVGRALTGRLTDDTIADVLIRLSLIVAWCALVVLAVTIVTEVVHMARHDGLSVPDVRGLGMPQSLGRVIATGLLVVVPVFTIPSRAGARDGPQLLPTRRVAAALVSHNEPPVAPPDDEWVAKRIFGASYRAGNAGGVDLVEGVSPSQNEPGRYVVRRGDSIYGIAEYLVGPDPGAVADFAERLLELNLGTRMPDGRHFTNAAFLDIGWVLELPPLTTGAVASPTPSTSHVVELGESLWSIADGELGDPTRWPEIYELNHGRSFDDGRQLLDPDLLHPGWELDLPSADRDDEALLGPESAHPDNVWESGAPGADVSSASDEALLGPESAHPDNVWESGAPGADVSSASDELDVVPDVVTSEDRVDGELHRSHDHASDSAAMPVPEPAQSVSVDTAPAVGGTDEEEFDEQPSQGPELLTLPNAAMLSAGVLTLLAVRRRNYLRRARPRSRLPAPASGPASIERNLRSVDLGDRPRRLDMAIRSVASALVEQGTRVLAVSVTPDGDLELRLADRAVLPAPWFGALDTWHLVASTPIEPPVEDLSRIGSPCPTMIQLGRDPEGRDVYVDLEACEAIEIGGSADHADAIVAAVAATLAGSVLAEVTTLIGLGVPEEAFLGHRLHVPAIDGPGAFDAAREVVGSTASATVSTFELRSRAVAGEAWEPAVVLAGSTVGTLAPPSSRTGMAVLSASPIQGPSYRLVPDGDMWQLEPIGLRLLPIGLRSAGLAELAELLDVRDPAPEPVGTMELENDDTIVVGDDADVGGPAHDAVGPDHEVGGGDDRDEARFGTTSFPVTFGLPEEDDAADGDVERGLGWRLMVRVLGPVEVISGEGEAVTFERSKARELIAWLATHRDHSTRSAARTALWELDVRDATFANVVSEARRSLARLVDPPEGDEWVGRTMTESLPLHVLVRTDAELVEQALAAARLQPPAQAIAALSPVVELISGLPFEGTSYLWPDAEGITSNLVLLATTAAAELAAHCLSLGDIGGVFRATGRGLMVLPGHEELIGLRMKAHARAGDHAGVRQEWESYERVINADPWSDGEPSPKLVELRRELLNPSR